MTKNKHLDELLKSMRECQPKRIVYDKFMNYRDAYKRMRTSICEEDRQFVDVYYRYIDYMNKLSGSQK